jgi:hypothetical protein
MRLDEVPCLGCGDFATLVLRARGGVVPVGAVDDASVGQLLHVVGVIAVFEGVVAGGGIAGGHGPRGRGRVGGGAEDLVLGAGTLQGELQTVVVRLQRVGAGLEGRQLGLELAHMALFALAEGALSAWEGVSLRAVFRSRNTADGGGATYAARFCALRLLWAGVRAVSFSSLLLRVLLARLSSTSPTPLSTLPTGMGVAAMAGSGEPCVVGRPGLKEKASYGKGSCERDKPSAHDASAGCRPGRRVRYSRCCEWCRRRRRGQSRRGACP